MNLNANIAHLIQIKYRNGHTQNVKYYGLAPELLYCSNHEWVIYIL